MGMFDWFYIHKKIVEGTILSDDEFEKKNGYLECQTKSIENTLNKYFVKENLYVVYEDDCDKAHPSRKKYNETKYITFYPNSGRDIDLIALIFNGRLISFSDDFERVPKITNLDCPACECIGSIFIYEKIFICLNCKQICHLELDKFKIDMKRSESILFLPGYCQHEKHEYANVSEIPTNKIKWIDGKLYCKKCLNTRG